MYRLEEEIQENEVSLNNPARYVWSRLSMAVALQNMVLNCSTSQLKKDELATGREVHGHLLFLLNTLDILDLLSSV